MRIEPCVVERKNKFIFENKITFDVSLLNTANIYRLDFKKVLNKFKSDLKVIHYFITKNNNCLFESQIKTLHTIQCV